MSKTLYQYIQLHSYEVNNKQTNKHSRSLTIRVLRLFSVYQYTVCMLAFLLDYEYSTFGVGMWLMWQPSCHDSSIDSTRLLESLEAQTV